MRKVAEAVHAGDATMQVVTDIGVARVYDAIVVAVEEVYVLLEHRAVVRAACINGTVIYPITQQQCSTLRFHALTQARSVVFHATRRYTCMSLMTLSPADCRCTPIRVALRLVDSGSAVGARLPGIPQRVFKQLDCDQQANVNWIHGCDWMQGLRNRVDARCPHMRVRM